MFEINSKPKQITIQVRVKSGEWMTLTKINAHRRYFSFDEVMSIMDLYEHLHNEAIRILNDYNKVILSSSSYCFCRLLDNAAVVTTHWLNSEDKNNLTTYSIPYNTLIPNIRSFQRLVARHGGIKKWKQYPLEERDDYTICGKLTFRDGQSMTVAIY